MKPRDTVILPARVKIKIAEAAKAQATSKGMSLNKWLNEAILLRLTSGEIRIWEGKEKWNNPR
jgi:hypothetical protein